MKITQTIAQAGTPNKNGRIYPKEVLQKAIDDFKEGEMFGRIGMQGDTLPVAFSEVSHIIDSLKLTGDDNFEAEITVLDTPNGKLLSEMMKSGDIVFRMCGMGDGQKNDDDIMVIEDFDLISVNAVSATVAS